MAAVLLVETAFPRYIDCSDRNADTRNKYEGKPMPHLKSAKKRLRQNLKRRDHNRAVKKTLKKQLKTVFEVGTDKAGTIDKLKAEAAVAVKKLDKAAARGVIHPNLAARKKSQIARLINTKSGAAPKK
jgi:small subunit ribosomal protein S20